MKLSVATVGKLVLVHLFLSQHNHGVAAELHVFFPDTLRKAKQGLNKVLRRSPTPPALAIPQRTGIASIDQALFQTSLIGSTMKGSLSRQLNTLMVSKSAIPNIFMLFMSVAPLDHFVSNLNTTVATTEQIAFVKDGFQHLQMVVRVLVSSQMLQISSVTLHDVLLTHASNINPTVQKAIQSLPAVIPQLAVFTLLVHSCIKFYNAVVLPFFRKESPTDENEFIATFTPIQFVEDDSVIVTDMASKPEVITLSTETNKEEDEFEVNVTKISAVLDRFESKILSLVGGTRFHPSPNVEIDNEETDAVSPIDMYVRATSETDVTTFELNDLCDEDQINLTEADESQTDELVQIEDACIESESVVSMDKESNPSLKSYEIILSSSSSPLLSALTTSPSKVAVRAFGVMALALSSVNVLPLVVRRTVAVVAAIVVVGIVVQEIRGVFSNGPAVNALDELIHDIEERTLSFTNKMEPVVVASRQDEEVTSTSRSPLRFWRTRLPILDGIANFSSRSVASPKNLEDENNVDAEVTEVDEAADSESPLFESAVHYYDKSEQDAPETVTKTSSPKNVWRWMSPVSAQPKMTRTACTAIVGM